LLQRNQERSEQTSAKGGAHSPIRACLLLFCITRAFMLV
jgi:hypothetical protein